MILDLLVGKEWRKKVEDICMGDHSEEDTGQTIRTYDNE
jgi:hypothetical protein